MDYLINSSINELINLWPAYSTVVFPTVEKLNVHTGKRDKILLAHVQRICEAHDIVMRSYYQQIYGSSGADATTSMENIGEQVYV